MCQLFQKIKCPKPKKIAVILPTLKGGGAEKVVITVCNKLIEKGLKVDIILLKRLITYSLTFQGNIISIFNKDVKLSKHPFFLTKNLISILKKYDTIIGGLELGSSFLAIILGKFLGKKTISWNHTYVSEFINANFDRLKGLICKSLVAIFYRFADVIVCVSEGVKMDLINFFKLPPPKIKVILNPVEVKNIRMKAFEDLPKEHKMIFEKPSIAFVGRLHSQKGLDILLKAFRKVLYNHDINLIILGEGDIADYKRLAIELGIENNVFFLGFQENPYSFLSRCKCLVLPSRYEGFGLVLIEAMVCGIPVIASNCPSGPSEILDRGRYGILVGVGDIDDLSKNIEPLLTNNDLHEKFSRLGKQRAEDFDIDKLINHYIDILI